MAGQIIPRGKGKWLVRVFLGRDESGKRRYHNKTIHGTKKDAERYLTAVLRERDLGTFVEPTRQTLNEYLDTWLKTVAKPRTRERTFQDYEALLRRYVREPLGEKRLCQITPAEIQGLYSAMLDRGLSARTVRYLHAVLHSALAQAAKWGKISRNPADLVDLPRQERKEMQVLNREEAQAFLEAAREDRWYPLFLLALTTGMRPGEYLALQWKDVNFESGTVSVCRTLVRRGKGWHFAEPKTRRSRRTIKLLTTTVEALRAHRKAQAEERLAAGPDYQDFDLVFATSNGAPLDEANLVNRHFKPILRRAKLKETLRLYDLRHTFATLQLLAGVNPKVVSEALGHSSVALTLDVYSHVLPNMQEGAADKLEDLLFQRPGTL